MTSSKSSQKLANQIVRVGLVLSLIILGVCGFFYVIDWGVGTNEIGRDLGQVAKKYWVVALIMSGVLIALSFMTKSQSTESSAE